MMAIGMNSLYFCIVLFHLNEPILNKRILVKL